MALCTRMPERERNEESSDIAREREREREREIEREREKSWARGPETEERASFRASASFAMGPRRQVGRPRLEPRRRARNDTRLVVSHTWSHFLFNCVPSPRKARVSNWARRVTAPGSKVLVQWFGVMPRLVSKSISSRSPSRHGGGPRPLRDGSAVCPSIQHPALHLPSHLSIHLSCKQPRAPKHSCSASAFALVSSAFG